MSWNVCEPEHVARTLVSAASRLVSTLFEAVRKSREGITSPSNPALPAAWEVGRGEKRRHECRRGRQECPRHIVAHRFSTTWTNLRRRHQEFRVSCGVTPRQRRKPLSVPRTRCTPEKRRDESKAESNNKLDKCLKRRDSKMDD